MSELDTVFDLIDGETRERSWALLKKGGILVSTLTPPSHKAKQFGVRALRYTVEADGPRIDRDRVPVESGKVKLLLQKTFPLNAAAEALASVEQGALGWQVVLTVDDQIDAI